MTKSGNTIGSFHYIAPERLGTRTDEDARADIYSLACVLYECLTGRPPFAEHSMARLVAAHLNTPPPNPSTTRPNVPPKFDRVIATGMAKHPDQRYATTVELANAAHDAITTPIPIPIPRPAPQPPVQYPSSPQIAATTVPRIPDPAPSPGPGLMPPTPPARHQSPTEPTPRPPHPPPAPSTPPASTDPWWRRKVVLIPAALLTIALLATVSILVATDRGATPTASRSPSTALPPPPTASPSPSPTYGTESVLPLTDIYPSGVAVDTTGTVYVTDQKNDRVLRLAAGTNRCRHGTVAVPELPIASLIAYGGRSQVATGSASTTRPGEAGLQSAWLPKATSASSVLPTTGRAVLSGLNP